MMAALEVIREGGLRWVCQPFPHTPSRNFPRVVAPLPHAPCCAVPQVKETELVQSEQLLELEQGEWEGRVRRECFTPELTAQFAADPWVSQ